MLRQALQMRAHPVLRVVCWVVGGLALLGALASVPTAFFGWCPQPNESFRCSAGTYDEAAVARAWLVLSLAVAASAAWVGYRLRRGARP
jgi:hypothetical protein